MTGEEADKNSTTSASPVIGLALGSGAARGWAHIGVIRELQERGIEPGIVCGSSIGALVGAALVGGYLDELEGWVSDLDWREILRYLDVSLLLNGGLSTGEKLFDFFRERVGERRIEDLDRPFGAVATDLVSGREVWLREGALTEAVRASIALPGLLTPVRRQELWLVDGGLVNPVPVSLCRALGAEVVIAVNLNGDIVGRHLRPGGRSRAVEGEKVERTLLERLALQFRQRTDRVLAQWMEPEGAPGLFNVVASSLNIMQDRITRSRMAGDPPDVLLSPRLAELALLEFDRAQEAVEEGRDCVRRSLPALQSLVQE